MTAGDGDPVIEQSDSPGMEGDAASAGPSAPAKSPEGVNLRRQLPLAALYLVTLGLAVIQLTVALHEPLGTDSHAYWLAWRGPMYTTGPMTRDAYLYSPAFAQAIWPLTQIPWFTLFAALNSLANAALLLWLLRPLGWWWAIPLTVFTIPEILNGNIFIPFAGMAVLGFRYPAAWAFTALTKVAPTVMPVWWLVRREWRQLGIWAATTLGIVALSALLAPDLWAQWLRHLMSWATSESQQQLGLAGFFPLLYRAPVGLFLVVVGARKGWRWTVPVGALLCTPVFWLGAYTWLAAIPRIRASHSSAGSAPTSERGGADTGNEEFG